MEYDPPMISTLPHFLAGNMEPDQPGTHRIEHERMDAQHIEFHSYLHDLQQILRCATHQPPVPLLIE